ncbi:MAG TPA: hypothetical protein VHF22_08500 [Planctomycetota bacterium]|nr:hypothetical protein [Planctomycetota bacterium]
MTDEARVWEEHAAGVKAIRGRCGEALRGPTPAAMTFPSFRAELSRLQGATAQKLGRAREDFKDRFAGEEAELKSMCGL